MDNPRKIVKSRANVSDSAVILPCHLHFGWITHWLMAIFGRNLMRVTFSPCNLARRLSRPLLRGSTSAKPLMWVILFHGFHFLVFMNMVFNMIVYAAKGRHRRFPPPNCGENLRIYCQTLKWLQVWIPLLCQAQQLPIENTNTTPQDLGLGWSNFWWSLGRQL
jgi:hypothetical protein